MNGKLEHFKMLNIFLITELQNKQLQKNILLFINISDPGTCCQGSDLNNASSQLFMKNTQKCILCFQRFILKTVKQSVQRFPLFAPKFIDHLFLPNPPGAVMENRSNKVWVPFLGAKY